MIKERKRQLRERIWSLMEKEDKESARREFELALKYNKNFEPAKKSLSGLQ